MTRFTFSFALLAFAGLMLFSTCGKDDDNGPGDLCGNNFNYVTYLQDELNAITQAATAYANDPTTANCQAYIATIDDYLDEAETIESCVLAADLTAYQQAIDEARTNLMSIQC